MTSTIIFSHGKKHIVHWHALPLSMSSPPLITIGITLTITVRNHVPVMINIVLIPRVKILLVSVDGFMVSAIKFQISAVFLFSNFRKRQIALYSPCWSVGRSVDVTIIFFLNIRGIKALY